MNFLKSKWFFLLSLLLVFSNCKDDEDTDDGLSDLKIAFPFTINGNELVHDQTYIDAGGLRVKVSLLKYYISNLKFISTSNDTTLIKDVFLYDSENIQTISSILSAGNYKTIEFGLGLTAEQNASDPDSYTADHPLSYAQAMHWGQWQKFKFLMIEGRADEDVNADTWNQAFSYHLGFDEAYRLITINKNFTLTDDGINEIDLTLEFNKMFYGENDTVNLITESDVHGAPNELILNGRIADLCQKSFD